MNTFEFQIDKTPLSNWHLAYLVPVLYLATIWGIKLCMTKYHPKGFNLKSLVIFHNASLSIISAILFIDMSIELGKMFYKGGIWSVFCDTQGNWTHGRIYYCLYINYLLKYVELGDTVLLALRAKPTPFLHVYHHAATLVLCLTQLRGQTSLQWLVVVINLFVHIVMYAFYALHALGYNVWWKRYLTMLQIGQFIVVVSVCSLIFILTPLHFMNLSSQKCHGDVFSQTFGMAILVSYLVLFIQFYDRTYIANKMVSKKEMK